MSDHTGCCVLPDFSRVTAGIRDTLVLNIDGHAQMWHSGEWPEWPGRVGAESGRTHLCAPRNFVGVAASAQNRNVDELGTCSLGILTLSPKGLLLDEQKRAAQWISQGFGGGAPNKLEANAGLFGSENPDYKLEFFEWIICVISDTAGVDTTRMSLYKSLQLCCCVQMGFACINDIKVKDGTRLDMIRHSIPWPSAQEIVGSSTDGKGVHGAEWDGGGTDGNVETCENGGRTLMNGSSPFVGAAEQWLSTEKKEFILLERTTWW
ncbi:hypothetical protein DFH94DRAFT_686385 [Russula ochroleuca]|uniref:Uncharacterized protein n=1 Tax=Russula ochroleuca TaxID=152965 RepID=A0A9P5MKT2_9AGAM|nr:hypothetical protein DFH94DRAFT_686385 [Russula ochroleuca]